MLVAVREILSKLVRNALVLALLSFRYTYRLVVGSAGDRLQVVQIQDADGVYRETRSCQHCLDLLRQHQELRDHVNELTQTLNEVLERTDPDAPPAEPETVEQLLRSNGSTGRGNGADRFAGLAPGQPTHRID